MPNRNLTLEELAKANVLLNEIRNRLNSLAGEDADLRFAFRRKVVKELSYDERGKPVVRNKLKAFKRGEQRGLCFSCQAPLPEKYTVLDRIVAASGYTEENTHLICETCDRALQASRHYT